VLEDTQLLGRRERAPKRLTAGCTALRRPPVRRRTHAGYEDRGEQQQTERASAQDGDPRHLL
jgi:hypothetical protein